MSGKREFLLGLQAKLEYANVLVSRQYAALQKNSFSLSSILDHVRCMSSAGRTNCPGTDATHLRDFLTLEQEVRHSYPVI